jgi:hypothetical protein
MKCQDLGTGGRYFGFQKTVNDEWAAQVVFETDDPLIWPIGNGVNHTMKVILLNVILLNQAIPARL